MERNLRLRGKRLIDLIGAAVGMVVLAPVLALTALALVATQGRPVLFRQVRPGLGGRLFRICKFRTMRPPRPNEVWYATDQLRITRIGRFLRATSIDELPELWNVLRGEMSLVGPRPLLVQYLDSYTSEEHRRHEMRPGLTSWAAVNGRHVVGFKERLIMDTWYVDHWGFGLDARIMAMTIVQVLRRADTKASQDLEAIGFPLARSAGDATGDGPPVDPSAPKGTPSLDERAGP